MINTIAARNAGLTNLNQIDIIQALAADAETMVTLARRFNVSGSAITGIADKLEKLGLIERKHGLEDRRSIWLKLTEKGRDLARKLVTPEPAKKPEPVAA